MLRKILSPNTCAHCKQCCRFDSYDVWNTPVLNERIRQKAEDLLPEIRFIPYGQASYRFFIPDLENEFACPLLDETSGCLLGAEKPFQCSIWPLCLMETEGSQVIAIDPICEEMANKPLGELLKLLKKGLAAEIFSHGRQEPDMVLTYDRMFPILMWEKN